MSWKTLTRRILAALTIIGLTSIAVIVPAVAHDELIDSTPKAQEVIEEAPEKVTLTFSGNLTTGEGIPNVILVRDAEDTNWAEGEAVVNGRTISTNLTSGMPDGEYRVSYRVVYSDGHPDEQMYTFTLDSGEVIPEEPETTQQPTATADPEVTGESEGNALPWIIGAGVVVVVLIGGLIIGFQRKKRNQESA